MAKTAKAPVKSAPRKASPERPAAKKVAAKVQAAKKPAAKARASADEEGLAAKRRELAALAKEMVLDDLSFMVRQAKVLIHNRETEALEEELAAESERPGSIAEARQGKREVTITRTAAGNANLSLGRDFKLLTPEELAAMARIAIDGTSVEDRLDRLYRWLDRERRDILHDGGIVGPKSPALADILSCFERTFSKRKGSGEGE